MFVYDDDETFTKNAFISLKIGANLPISSAILRQMTHSCNSFEKCKLHVRKVGPLYSNKFAERWEFCIWNVMLDYQFWYYWDFQIVITYVERTYTKYGFGFIIQLHLESLGNNLVLTLKL